MSLRHDIVVVQLAFPFSLNPPPRDSTGLLLRDLHRLMHALQVRLFRQLLGLKVGGMGTAHNKFLAWYFHAVFRLVWIVHGVVRPVLGCGCSNPETKKVATA
jgi:hypothetical protein